MPGASDFLKRKRMEQKQNRMSLRNVPPSYNQRYGFNDMNGFNMASGKYTGSGPNNRVEPFLPTERRIDSNGRPYIADEGEVIVTDARTVQDYGGPQRLDTFIQQNRPSGRPTDRYACGGTPSMRRYYTGGIPSAYPSPQQRQQNMQMESMPSYQVGGVPTAQQPMQSPISAQPPKPMVSPIKGAKQPITTGVQKIQDPMKGPIIPTNIQNKIPTNKTNIQGPVGQNLIKTGQVKPPVIDPKIKIDPITPITPVIPIDPNINITPPDPVVPDPIPVTPDVPVTPDQPPVPPYTLPQVGGDPVDQQKLDQMIWDRYMSKKGAMDEAQRASEAQRAMQAGIGTREMLGREAIGDISRRAATGDMAADFAIDAARRAEQTGKEKQALDFQKEQFEFQKGKFNKEFEWMQKQYGDQDFQRMWADIANGMTLEQAQAKYPNAKLTESSFASIQATTPMATQNYQKKWDAVNMLLQQGGAENMAQAQTMLKGMLGADIDFTNALKAENVQGFNNGMAQMSKYIASGMDWQQAIKAMEKDGTLDQLGLMEGDVQKMYQQMQLNSSPLYQTSKYIDQMVNSGQLTKEEGDQMMDLYKWSIMNPQGFKLSDSYQVVDKNGVEVANFKTEQEAQKFLTENPNLGYQQKLLKNGWVTVGNQAGQTGQTGTTGDVVAPPVTEGGFYEQDGTLFTVKNGKAEPIFDIDVVETEAGGKGFVKDDEIYTLNDKGVATKINESVLKDPWGVQADILMELSGEIEDMELKDNLFKKRAEQMLSGEKEFEEGEFDLDSHKYIVDNAKEFDLGTYNWAKGAKNNKVKDDGLGFSGNKKRKRYMIDEFEGAPGQQMVVNGMVVTLKGKERREEGGYDGTIYFFEPLGNSGHRLSIYIDGDGKIVNTWSA